MSKRKKLFSNALMMIQFIKRIRNQNLSQSEKFHPLLKRFALKGQLIVFLLFFFCIIAQGQSNNAWLFSRLYELKRFTNDSFSISALTEPRSIKLHIDNHFEPLGLKNYDDEFTHYGVIRNFPDSSSNIINAKNGNRLKITIDNSPKEFEIRCLQIVPVSEKEIVCVFLKSNAPRQINSTLYYSRVNLETGIISDHNEVITGSFPIMPYHKSKVIQKPQKNHEYWLLLPNRDSMCVFDLSRSGITLNDVAHERPRLILRLNYEYQYLSMSTTISNSKEKVVLSEYDDGGSKQTSIYSFDKEKGKIKFNRLLSQSIVYTRIDTLPQGIRITYHSLRKQSLYFTKGDSFLLGSELLAKKVELNRNIIQRDTLVYHLKRYRCYDESYEIDSLHLASFFKGHEYTPNINMQRDENGKFMFWSQSLPGNEVYFHLNRIKNENTEEVGNINFERNLLTVNYNDIPHFSGNFGSPITPTYYPEIQIDTSCFDSVQIRFTGPSYFNDFRSHIIQNGDTVLTDTSANPVFLPSESGKYSVHFRARRNEGSWKEIDTFFYYQKDPELSFEIEKKNYCELQRITLNNTSAAAGEDGVEWSWSLITKDTSIALSDSASPTILLRDTGHFKVRLGYVYNACSMQLESQDSFRILPAPVSSFTYSTSSSCAPATVNYGPDSLAGIKKIKYSWRDGEQDSGKLNKKYIPNDSLWWVQEKIEGDNGCIRLDTHYIKLSRRLKPTDSLQLKTVSLVSPGILSLNSDTFNGVNLYELLRKSETGTYWLDTFNSDEFPIHDSFLQTGSMYYQYQIRGIDSCGNRSALSNIGRSIHLSGEYDHAWRINLQWNRYAHWKGGVEDYQVHYSEDGTNWTNVASTSNNEIQLQPFKNVQVDSLFYRVVAIPGNRSLYNESRSNVVSIPISSPYFLPNSFTPNGDGLNDTWCVKGIGIEALTCKIYGRNGQLLNISTDATNLWNGYTQKGSLVESGTYFYTLRLRFSDGKEIVLGDGVQVIY